MAAASAGSSTTATRPRRTTFIQPGCGSSRPVRPPTPTTCCAPKRRYWAKSSDPLTNGTPIDRALVRRPGRDVTLIAYGPMVATALETAEAAEVDVEVIDLRSLAPFDDETVCASVRRTGRAVVVHEAPGFLGYGAEVAARVTEQCFHYLHAPVARVTGFDIPYPPPMLEEHHLPSVDRILDAIERLQWDDTAVLPDA